MNVLLVEDNPADARMVELMFRSEIRDSTLVTSGSFAHAAEALRAQQFDVILLDLGLPDGQGLDLVNRMRGETSSPIVVLSGSGDEELAALAVREGAQDYLVKGHVDEFLLARALRYAIERGQEAKRMATLAFYDALTGLQNRSSFMLSFEQTLGRARRERRQVACMFVDLDGFKAVNDTLGHQAGDHVLIVVAQILRDSVRASDLVCRLGGDEFVVVLSSITKPTDAGVVAEKILLAIDRPIGVSGKRAHVTASIGISFFPEDSESPETLVRIADAVMYEAKKAGKNRFAASPEHPARRHV